jgi:hypothetical protein
MGAQDFYQTVWREPDVAKAYRHANDVARQYRGHQDGYTGDIQTTDGWEVRSRTPMTEQEASDFTEEDIDNAEKRGAAFAVPLLDRWVEVKPLTPAQEILAKVGKFQKPKPQIAGWLFYGVGAI